MVDAILFILGWTLAILCFLAVLLAIWTIGPTSLHAGRTAYLLGGTSLVCFVGYGFTKL